MINFKVYENEHMPVNVEYFDSAYAETAARTWAALYGLGPGITEVFVEWDKFKEKFLIETKEVLVTEHTVKVA